MYLVVGLGLAKALILPTPCTTGTPIQAHGGGFLKVSDTWYWVGEDKTTNTGGSGFFYAVSIYASKDLVTWEHRNKISATATDSQLASDRIIERPKIIYNDKTNMYVMWTHWDNTAYTDSNAGIFKSPTIDGNYTYRVPFTWFATVSTSACRRKHAARRCVPTPQPARHPSPCRRNAASSSKVM